MKIILFIGLINIIKLKVFQWLLSEKINIKKMKMTNWKKELSKYYFHSQRSTKISLVLIFILGLTPLLYFLDGSLIIGGDAGYQLLDPIFQLSKLYSWDIVHGSGYNNPTYYLLSSFLIPLSFLSIVGLPLFVSQALFLTFLLMASGFSMFFLIRSLCNNKTNLVATSSAIFYMFNPFTLLSWSAPDLTTLSAITMYPFMFALFVKGIKSKKYVKSAMIFSLGSLIFTAGNVHIPFIILILFSLFLYSLFHIISAITNKTQISRFILLAPILYILVNLWWILPILSYQGEGMRMLESGLVDPLDKLKGFSSYSSILHLFQLYGYPGWEDINWGRSLFSYVPTLVSNPFFIALSFLPPILLGFALLLRSKIKNLAISGGTLLFFSFLYLFSLFLSKGTHEPFGEIFYNIFDQVPLFVIFRSVFTNFGIMMALSLSILFGMSLGIIYHYLESKEIMFKISTNARTIGKINIQTVMLVVIVFLILISNYPFFTGEVVHNGKGSFPSFHHKIPEYYQDAADWINNQSGDYNVFSLYGGGGGWVVYNWDNNDTYVGLDTDQSLIHRQLIAPPQNDLSYYIYQSILLKSTNQVSHLLTQLNVKYLILHLDFDPSLYGSINPETIRNAILLQKDIRLVKSFGKIEIYQNDAFRSLHIYGTNNVYNSNITEFINILSIPQSEMYPVFISENLPIYQSSNILQVPELSLFQIENENKNISFISEKGNFNLSTYIKWNSFNKTLFFSVNGNNEIGIINQDIEKIGSYNWFNIEEVSLSKGNNNITIRWSEITDLEKQLLNTNTNISKWIPISNNWNTNNSSIAVFNNNDTESWIYSDLDPQTTPFIIDVNVTFTSTPTTAVGKHGGLMLAIDKKQRYETSGYAIFWSDTGHCYSIFRYDNGSYTALGVFEQPNIIDNLSHNWNIKVDFSTLTLYVDGGYIGTINDEKYMKDLEVGFWGWWNQSIQFDNLKIINTPPEIKLISLTNQIIDGSLNIMYKEINPTKFLINVNTTQPFILVFSETYHDKWNAYINGQQVPNEYHFMINGYANAWYINNTGSFEIVIEFMPQKLVYIGASISFLAIFFMSVYINKHRIKALFFLIKKDQDIKLFNETQH